jgi:hypothetical protein
MRVEIIDLPGGLTALRLDGNQLIKGMSEHALRDLEFVLAQRRAMARRCTAEAGEHACGLAPAHDREAAHVCRACTKTWLDEAQVTALHAGAPQEGGDG